MKYHITGINQVTGRRFKVAFDSFIEACSAPTWAGCSIWLVHDDGKRKLIKRK